MNRDQAMGRLSVVVLFVSLLLLSTAATLMYAIPMSDVLRCERATGTCLVRHRTMLRSRAGQVPLATVRGVELKEGARRGAARLELWLRAGADSFWVADYATWERTAVEARLAEGRRFLGDTTIRELELRRDHTGGPIAAMVTLGLAFLGLIAAMRLRMRIPERAARGG